MADDRRPEQEARVRTRSSLRNAICPSSWTDERVHGDGSRTGRRTARNLLNSPQRCQLRTMLHGLSDVESTHAAGPLVGIRRLDYCPATAAPDASVLLRVTRRMAAAANPAECFRVSWADGWHVNRLRQARGLERLVLESRRTRCAQMPPCWWIGRMEERDAGGSEQPS
jgi:hypothetical protein